MVFLSMLLLTMNIETSLNICLGDYVKVDAVHHVGRQDSEGGAGFVESLSPMNVRYVISGLLSPAIDRQRIHKATIATRGRRVGIDGAPTPSILDPDYSNHISQQIQLATTCTNLFTSTSCCRTDGISTINSNDCNVNTAHLISLLVKNSTKKHTEKNKGLELIEKMNDKYEKGWLRINEGGNSNSSISNKNTYLAVEEKEKILKLILCLKMICHRAVDKISFAWDTSRYTLIRLMNDAKLGKAIKKRKENSNKGLTYFNGEAKRQSTINSYSVFCKAKRMENRFESLSNDQIYSSWCSLNVQQKQQYDDLADHHKERSRNLLVDVG